MSNETRPAYWDYLKLDRLLELQQGLAEREDELASDELHFIIVHQVYELWFKLVLRELRLARDHLAAPRVAEEHIPHVVHHLGRVSRILRLGIAQWDVMETLTPQDFLAFRDKLVPASGFQSFQMRQIEILLGLDETQRPADGIGDPLEAIRSLAAASPGGAYAWGRIAQARAETSLRTALHAWLYRTPIHGSSPGDAGDEDVVLGFLRDYLAAHGRSQTEQLDWLPQAVGAPRGVLAERFATGQAEAHTFLLAEDAAQADRPRLRRVRAGLLFIESYRRLPLLAWPRLLVDAVVDVEEQLVLFRTHHARMVERTIGRRTGTGGSAGVEYLDRTTKLRVFPELWSVRTLLLPPDRLPPLQRPEVYGFVRGA